MSGRDHGRQGPGRKPWPLFFALLVPLVSGILQLAPGAAQRLELARGRILASEPWRFVSGHLVHYSSSHWLMDALAFLVLALACLLRSPARTLATLAVGAPLVSLAVLAFLPGLERYRGLSALDSALFGLLLALELRTRRSPWVLVAGALFVAKVGFELVTGRALFVDGTALGFLPVPLAHALGALVGLAFGFSARHAPRAGALRYGQAARASHDRRGSAPPPASHSVGCSAAAAEPP